MVPQYAFPQECSPDSTCQLPYHRALQGELQVNDKNDFVYNDKSERNRNKYCNYKATHVQFKTVGPSPRFREEKNCCLNGMMGKTYVNLTYDLNISSRDDVYEKVKISK